MMHTRTAPAGAAIAATIGLLLAPAGASAIPMSGLIGLYTFDAADGTDSSGSGNHGAVGAGVGFTAPGGGVDGGRAASFTVQSTGANPTANAGDSVVVPVDIGAASLPALTMGAWVRPASTGQGGVGKVLSHDNGGFDRTLGIDSRGANAGTGYAMFTGAGVLDSPSSLLVLDDWQFIAARYGGGTASLTVGTSTASTTDFSGGNVGVSSLFIGSNPFFNEDFDGLIDNVFLYDRFLSDAELADIRDNGVLPQQQGVSEPGGLALLGGGLLALGAARRRGRSR